MRKGSLNSVLKQKISTQEQRLRQSPWGSKGLRHYVLSLLFYYNKFDYFIIAFDLLLTGVETKG